MTLNDDWCWIHVAISEVLCLSSQDMQNFCAYILSMKATHDHSEFAASYISCNLRMDRRLVIALQLEKKAIPSGPRGEVSRLNRFLTTSSAINK